MSFPLYISGFPAAKITRFFEISKFLRYFFSKFVDWAKINMKNWKNLLSLYPKIIIKDFIQNISQLVVITL